MSLFDNHKKERANLSRLADKYRHLKSTAAGKLSRYMFGDKFISAHAGEATVEDLARTWFRNKLAEDICRVCSKNEPRTKTIRIGTHSRFTPELMKDPAEQPVWRVRVWLDTSVVRSVLRIGSPLSIGVSTAANPIRHDDGSINAQWSPSKVGPAVATHCVIGIDKVDIHTIYAIVTMRIGRI